MPTELGRPSSDRQSLWATSSALAGKDGLEWRGDVIVPIASSRPQILRKSIQFKLKFIDGVISRNQVTAPNLTY